MVYKLDYSKNAIKHLNLLKQAKLYDKAMELLEIIQINPFQNPPPYKKLRGKDNRFSRRINIQHRLVYEIENDTIKVLQMWSHYDSLLMFFNL